MNALKAIVVIAIVAGGIWWFGEEQQETDRQRAIIRQVSSLPQPGHAVPEGASIRLRGKALVWDMASDARSGAYCRLPSELRATSADRPITVFMVTGTRDEQVGTYSISGQPAYRRYVEITAAVWPELKPAGKSLSR
jgi:hypothetical protein